MSLIEQAANRLEQLRKAGVEIPDEVPAAIPPSEPPAVKSTIQQAAEALPGSAVAQPAPRHQQVATAPRAGAKAVSIDLDLLGRGGFITPKAPRAQIADEFRVIKRPLIANALGKGAAPVANGNLIMITSAVPGEGKTFTAVNLAMSIAMELDTTVMLVDADVANPSVFRVLGLPPGPGLLDVLVKDSLDLGEVLLRTNVDKLTLLPAGTQHPRATELLASDSMARLIEDMARRYDDRIIIFDSPPLLVTTEARALAAHMGQIVVVTRAERTLHGQVTHALATIENCPVKLMVLNKSRERGPGSYYGYGYGYGEDVRTEAA